MLMNWRGIRANCFLARSTQTLCKILFSSALLTCLVLTSNISSFSSSEFLYKWKGLCQWNCAKIPGELGQTGKAVLFALWSQAGGWVALQLWETRLQYRQRGIRWDMEGWFKWDEWTHCPPAGKWLSSFISSGKYFNYNFFFSINFLLRSFFIFGIKGNRPWHNNGWTLLWKSQPPVNTPCSFSRHFPTKGSGISAVPVCAPNEFYLGWFMFLPVSTVFFFFFFFFHC